MINAAKSPTDAVCSKMTFKPPSQITIPRVIDDNNSAMGKNTELYHTVLIQPFLWRSLISLKRWYSIVSRAKS